MAYHSNEWFESLTYEQINSMTREEMIKLLREDGGRASQMLRSSVEAIRKWGGGTLPVWLDTPENAQAAKRKTTWQAEPWKPKENDTIGTLRGRVKDLKNFMLSRQRSLKGIQESTKKFVERFQEVTGSQFSTGALQGSYMREREFFEIYSKVTHNLPEGSEDEGRGSWQIMRIVNDVITINDTEGRGYSTDDMAGIVRRLLERNAEEIEDRRVSETPQTSDLFDLSDDDDD